MPTYSYACTACDNRFDIAQAFTDDTLTTCEQCSGRLRKLFGSVGVVFKGSGFYRNDSRESTQGSHGNSTKSAEKSGGTEKSGGAEKSGDKTGSSSNGSGSGDSSAGNSSTGNSSSGNSSSGKSGSNGSSSNGSSSGAGAASSSRAASG